MSTDRTHLSFCIAHKHYVAACAHVGSKGYGGNDVASRQTWLRKVSVEFHRRLKAAGIPVEEGRAS